VDDVAQSDSREASVLAYDFPLLSVILVLLVLAAIVAIVFAVIWAFIDNFRRHDHSGWAKAGWCALILIFPLIGTLIYIIARPSDPDAVAIT
jgi:hypothetical protein